MKNIQSKKINQLASVMFFDHFFDMTDLQTINDNHSRRKSAAPPSDGKAALSILVVENHDDTRLLLKTLFEAKGYTVSESDSGEDAVQTALDNLPNLILMGLTLPQIDGLTAMRLIRERLPLSQNVPVVILSGRAEPAIEIQARALGCDAFLVKPFDIGRLEQIVAEQFSKKTQLSPVA